MNGNLKVEGVVYGSANYMMGVYGSASSYYGVFGVANNYGVYGSADNNYGVYGVAKNNYGVFGVAKNYGVYGSANNCGVYGYAPLSGWAGYFEGDIKVVNYVYTKGLTYTSTGTLLIDHPLDPENKTLRHSFVESPEDLCLYRGKVTLDTNGQATVKMPHYFAALTKEDEATVTLTPVGKKSFLTSYEWNQGFTAFTIYGNAGRKVTYLVLADRDDPAIHQFRCPVEEEKGNGKFEKGQLLNPEAYGKAKEESKRPEEEEQHRKRLVEILTAMKQPPDRSSE